MTGCPSVAVLGSARTLDRGRTQAAVALGVAGGVVTRRPYNDTSSSSAATVGPQTTVLVRHGVTDRVELGARLWTSGLQLDGKFAVIRSEAPGFDLSIAPSLGVIYVPTTGYVPSIPIQLAVLGGFDLGWARPFAGPRVMDRIVFYQGPINTWSLGGSLGISIALGHQLRLVPEVSVLVPLGSTVTEVFLEAGLGMTFGGER
jgi:hypothetical protein